MLLTTSRYESRRRRLLRTLVKFAATSGKQETTGENGEKKKRIETWPREPIACVYTENNRAITEQPTDQTRSDDQSQGRPAPSVCAIGSLSRALLMANRVTSMEVAVLVLLLLLAAGAGAAAAGAAAAAAAAAAVSRWWWRRWWWW